MKAVIAFSLAFLAIANAASVLDPLGFVDKAKEIFSGSKNPLDPLGLVEKGKEVAQNFFNKDGGIKQVVDPLGFIDKAKEVFNVGDKKDDDRKDSDKIDGDKKEGDKKDGDKKDEKESRKPLFGIFSRNPETEEGQAEGSVVPTEDENEVLPIANNEPERLQEENLPAKI